MSKKKAMFFNQATSGFDTDSFIYTLETTTVDEIITIPIRNTVNYDVIMDWGDGSALQTITGVNQVWSHTYPVAGTHTITISENTPNGWKGMYAGGSGDITKVRDIIQWGTSAVENFKFYGMNGVGTITATDEPNWSALTTMSNTFRNSTIRIPNFNLWTPTGITNYQGAFRDADVTGYTFDNWVTASTTNIDLMFLAATGLDADLSSWVMENMSNASLFAQNATSSWTSGTTNFSNTLIGWAAQAPNLPIGIGFGVITGATYDSSATASKTTLQSAPYLWTWTDGGLV